MFAFAFDTFFFWSGLIDSHTGSTFSFKIIVKNLCTLLKLVKFVKIEILYKIFHKNDKADF